MPSFFTPPTVDDIPRVLPDTRGPARLLMRHYAPLTRGRSVLKVAGHYVTRDIPATNDLIAAGREGFEWFLGGHLYIVTDAVATALLADGYELQTTEWEELTDTWGSYASDTWGTIG